jgi:hypothetical protein
VPDQRYEVELKVLFRVTAKSRTAARNNAERLLDSALFVIDMAGGEKQYDEVETYSLPRTALSRVVVVDA